MSAFEASTFQQSQEAIAAAIAGLAAHYPDAHIAPQEPTGQHAQPQYYANERPAPAARPDAPWLGRQPAQQTAPRPAIQTFGRPAHSQRLPVSHDRVTASEVHSTVKASAPVIAGKGGAVRPEQPRSLADAETGKFGPEVELSPWAAIYRRPPGTRDKEGVPVERQRFRVPAPGEEQLLTRMWDRAGIDSKDALPMAIVKRHGEQQVTSEPEPVLGKVSDDRNVVGHRKETSRTVRFMRRAIGTVMLAATIAAPLTAFYQPGSAQ